MSRIKKAFNRKAQAAGSKLLSLYCTAGFPERDDTIPVCLALQESGADMIELGFPYSDPLADGPTIQASSERALAKGMSLKILFKQLRDLRPAMTIPVLLMGYYNPVLQYGIQRFLDHCQEVGIDGLIIPDLPLEEYLREFKTSCETRAIDMIFLITPETEDARILELDHHGSGFIYAVSTLAVTGGKLGADQARDRYLQRVSELGLKNPVMVGFGISDRESFEQATQYASGGIIGSAFIRTLQKSLKVQNKDTDKNLECHIRAFVQEFK